MKSEDAYAFMEPDSHPLTLHGFVTVVIYFVHLKAHPAKASWSV